MSAAALDFLNLCRARGVDPTSIPDRGAASLSAESTTASAATLISLAYEIGAAVRGRDIDAIGRRIYSAHNAGALSEVAVALLDEARARRRAEHKAKRQWWERCYGEQLKAPRDRLVEKDKRRGLVRLGWLPPSIANCLTPGEEAVAAVYAEDFRRKGMCDDTKAQLAQRAGVVERVVQRAQRTLAATGAITIRRRPRNKQRHDSTVVVVVDAAWRQWLRNRRVHDRKSPSIVGDCKGERAGSVHLLQLTNQATVGAEMQQGLANGDARQGLKPIARVANAAEPDDWKQNGSFPMT